MRFKICLKCELIKILIKNKEWIAFYINSLIYSYIIPI